MNMDSSSAARIARLGERLDSRMIGIGLVFTATVAWSLSGLYTRMLSTDVWTAIAWRSLFGGTFLLAMHVAANGRHWLSGFAIGRAGLLLAACQVVCHVCTIGAFYFTTVANVTVIYATAPFIAAFLAYVLFGEPFKAATLWASVFCLIGVMIIVSDSFAGGHLPGNMFAFGMTLSFAFVIVIPRMRRTVRMLPTTIVSAFAAFALFVPLSTPSGVDAHDWIVLAAFGFTNFTLALFLFLLGARRIPSAEAALIGTTEIVLAPLWVWLVFAEQPSPTGLIGASVVLLAVVAHTLLDLRRKPLADAACLSEAPGPVIAPREHRSRIEDPV